MRDLKGDEGGYLKGFHPKLNSHCWKDIKLAAGKNPELKQNVSNIFFLILNIFLPATLKYLVKLLQFLPIERENQELVVYINVASNHISWFPLR